MSRVPTAGCARRAWGLPRLAAAASGAALAAALATAAPADPASSLLTSNDLAQLDGALQAMGMAQSDLGFDKDIAKPRWALAWVREGLGHPLQIPQAADRILAASTGTTEAVWRLAGGLLEAPPAGAAPEAGDGVFAASNTLSPHLAGYIHEFVEQAALANGALERALAPVPLAARRYAATSLLSGLLMAEEHPECEAVLLAAGLPAADVARVRSEWMDLDPAPAASNVLEALLGIDMGELLRGGEVLQAAATRLEGQLRTVHEWPGVPVTIPTALGPVIVGTTGSDRYAGPALLVVDPGGDDRYDDGAGVANGLMAKDPAGAAAAGGVPLAVIIDLGGDDTYASAGLLGPGTALFGLSVLIDGGGNDTHKAAYAGQAAALGGVAWLADRGGDDTYRGGVFGQAAAIAGLAVLDDEGGDDVYTVGLAGQAYAGVRGFGWLIDRAGHDRYLAGNREVDNGRHPDRFLSMAQGFAIGIRPFSGGGVAALVDLQGNDTYVADVFGQGASYWYSAGFLIDAAGHDTYRAFHYGQGSGIHLSAGLLADLGGDDTYSGSVLMQGNGHDYGVGILLDAAGNDTYTADQYSQGRGLFNGLGLLVDAAGDDLYTARMTNECQGLGHPGDQREYGCLGMLVDGAGADRYSFGVSDGAAVLRPWYGVIWDGTPDGGATGRVVSGLRAFDHADRPLAAPQAPVAPEGPARLPAFQVRQIDWSSLTVPQLIVIDQRPGTGALHTDAETELGRRGAVALEGLMRLAHLENMTVQLRTQAAIDALPAAESMAVLTPFLGAPQARTRRLAAYYLANAASKAAGRNGAPDPAALPGLRRLLADDEAAGAAIRALGKWRDRESVGAIAGFLHSDKEVRRVTAAHALGEIGDPASIPALLAALGDPVFTVRLTAQRALISLGAPAEKAAVKAWPAATPGVRRRLLGVLAAGETRAARRLMATARRDADPGVRADAGALQEGRP